MKEIDKRALEGYFYTDDCQERGHCIAIYLVDWFGQWETRALLWLLDYTLRTSLNILGFCATKERKKPGNLLNVAANKWSKGGCMWWHAGKTTENYSLLQGRDLQNLARDQESLLLRAYSSAVLHRNSLCFLFCIYFYVEKPLNIPAEKFKLSMRCFWHFNEVIILYVGSCFLPDF